MFFLAISFYSGSNPLVSPFVTCPRITTQTPRFGEIISSTVEASFTYWLGLKHWTFGIGKARFSKAARRCCHLSWIGLSNNSFSQISNLLGKANLNQQSVSAMLLSLQNNFNPTQQTIIYSKLDSVHSWPETNNKPQQTKNPYLTYGMHSFSLLSKPFFVEWLKI